MTPSASPTTDRLAVLLDWDGSAGIEVDWPALTEAAATPFPRTTDASSSASHTASSASWKCFILPPGAYRTSSCTRATGKT